MKSHPMCRFCLPWLLTPTSLNLLLVWSVHAERCCPGPFTFHVVESFHWMHSQEWQKKKKREWHSYLFKGQIQSCQSPAQDDAAVFYCLKLRTNNQGLAWFQVPSLPKPVLSFWLLPLLLINSYSTLQISARIYFREKVFPIISTTPVRSPLTCFHNNLSRANSYMMKLLVILPYQN